VVKQLSLAVKSAIMDRAMMEAANSDTDLIEAFHQTVQAHGLGIIRFSLTQSLLIKTVRCWDHKGRGRKGKGERASLPSLLHALQQTSVADNLMELAADWHPDMNRAERNREIFRNQLAVLVAGIEEQDREDRKERRDRLVKYRDTFIAHNLIRLPPEMPIYDDIFGLLDETIPLVEAASVAVLGHDQDLSGCREVSEVHAWQFWASVRAGQLYVRRRERARDRLAEDPHT
jgi:hypothetical protein